MKNSNLTCPRCGSEIVLPQIPKNPNPPLGIIGEFPGAVEMEVRAPFVGPTGDILRRELSRIGIDARQVVLTNLWPHFVEQSWPSKRKLTDEQKEACRSWGVSQAIRAVRRCKIVLLLGSETSLAFMGYNVSEITGLNLFCHVLDKPVLCAYNPAALAKGMLGEWRLVMEKLRKELKLNGHPA